MDANEPVVVFTTNNPGEADVLRNVLEGEGIKCALEGENQGSLTGILDIRLVVRAWEQDRARAVLEAHAHRHRDSEGRHPH